jgi:ABC-2 type transport system ATP-binding protein
MHAPRGRRRLEGVAGYSTTSAGPGDEQWKERPVDELAEVPVVLWVVAAAAVTVMVAFWVDIARREVRHLPKLVWALLMLSLPLGPILYLVLGRVPPGESAVEHPHVPRPDPRPPPRAAAPAAGAHRHGPPVISTHGLGKTYGDTQALRDVDLLVPRGSTYGLIGPNGAGKTTMLSVLAGLRRPSSGRLELAVPRRALGVLVDTPQFEPWLTAREVVDLARHLTAPETPSERVEQVLVEVGLEEAIGRRNGGFSRGMLQRLGLASCLVGDPEVLLLDEPSSALDPAGRREVLDLIGRLASSKTVVLSTHILADVQQVCDLVGVIDRGRLRFQGPLQELLSHTSSAYRLHVRAPADDLADALRRQPWTTRVEQQAPGRLHLVVADATAAEREVPRLVAEHGLPLVSFNAATDLETAFLELTT